MDMEVDIELLGQMVVTSGRQMVMCTLKTGVYVFRWNKCLGGFRRRHGSVFRDDCLGGFRWACFSGTLMIR